MQRLIPIVLFVSAMLVPTMAQADGASTFSQQCAQCHGKQGEGMQYVAPALKGNEFVRQASADELRKVVRNGRAGDEKRYPNEFPAQMPAVSESQVTAAELDELIAYLKGPLQE